MTKPQDPAIPLPSTGMDSTMTDNDPWDWKRELWPTLKRAGWVCKRAPTSMLSAEWLYIRPGRQFKGGTEHVDYFTTIDAVTKYCKRLENGRGESGGSRATTASVRRMLSTAKKRRKQQSAVMGDFEEEAKFLGSDDDDEDDMMDVHDDGGWVCDDAIEKPHQQQQKSAKKTGERHTDLRTPHMGHHMGARTARPHRRASEAYEENYGGKSRFRLWLLGRLNTKTSIETKKRKCGLYQNQRHGHLLS